MLVQHDAATQLPHPMSSHTNGARCEGARTCKILATPDNCSATQYHARSAWITSSRTSAAVHHTYARGFTAKVCAVYAYECITITLPAHGGVGGVHLDDSLCMLLNSLQTLLKLLWG